MKSSNDVLRQRTLAFALDVIKFIEPIPYNSVTKVLTVQLCKSSTSIGSNWRAYCRGRSTNERFSKICIVVEEADESQFWLEIFANTDYGEKSLLAYLQKECDELTKIMTSIKSSLQAG